MTNPIDLIIDPCNPNFAIDQHGVLCKRVMVPATDPTKPPHDLGFVQKGER